MWPAVVDGSSIPAAAGSEHLPVACQRVQLLTSDAFSANLLMLKNVERLLGPSDLLLWIRCVQHRTAQIADDCIPSKLLTDCWCVSPTFQEGDFWEKLLAAVRSELQDRLIVSSEWHWSWNAGSFELTMLEDWFVRAFENGGDQQVVASVCVFQM